MKTLIDAFIADESGATAIEYALIAAIVAMGLVNSLTDMSTALDTSYTSSANSFPE
jgi:pilus assembly protein Flp/PilA